MTKSTPQSRKNMRARTKLVHAGRDPSEQFGFVNTPIYRGSTVLQPTLADAGSRATETLFLRHPRHADHRGAGKRLVGDRRRRGNGAHAFRPLGDLVALLTALKAGDHLLVTNSAYRPTRTFCNGFLRRMGIETTYYDPLVGAGIAELMRAQHQGACSSRRRARKASRCRTFPPSPRSRMREAPA